MQALNLQILESQNQKIQPKNFSSLKNETKSGMSFRDMVKSMSKRNEFTKNPVKHDSHAEEISETIETEKADVKADSKNVSENEKPVKRISSKDTEKSSSKETSASLENLSKEISDEAVKVIPAEYIPADFKIKNEIVSNTDSLNDGMISEEAVQINDSEISYLKEKASSSNDPMVILENAKEYENKDELVINAQNLSLENPEKFLEGRNIASENNEAAEVSVAMFGNISQIIDTSAADGSKEKTESPFNLEVVDSDSEIKPDATSLFKDVFTVTDNRSVEEKITQFKSMVNKNSENASENNINLALSMSDNATQNILSSNSQAAGATGSTFQEMLTQQIQTNVPDFVKAGNIILRDNNQGTINMVLKPEALGNVKINLQVTDNVITGQITVHSKEAFEAFKQNMDSLRQAFQDSGFENANLNLSFADSSSSGAFAQQGERQQSGEQFFGNKMYRNYAASAETDDYAVDEVSYESGFDKQVSIVA